MTDKRILKTKKCLKEALAELLISRPLEKISVTEICDLACTGRATFYTYYDDKYDLLQDCFRDVQEEILLLDKRKSSKSGGLKACYLNLFDSILEVEAGHMAALKAVMSSQETISMYYHFMVDTLESFQSKACGDGLSPRYDRKQLNAFLVLGFWGFIHAAPDADQPQLRRDAHALISDLIDSPIFQTIE